MGIIHSLRKQIDKNNNLDCMKKVFQLTYFSKICELKIQTKYKINEQTKYIYNNLV